MSTVLSRAMPQIAGLFSILIGVGLIGVGTKRIDGSRRYGWLLSLLGVCCGAAGLAALGVWL